MESVKRGAGFGLFLLLIGVIWILVKVDIITLSIFDSLYTLWPLILVVIGVSIIFRRNIIVRTALWVVFLAVLILHSYFIVGRNSDYNSRSFASGSDVTVERRAETQTADLKIALGGTKLNVDSNISNKNNLLEAKLQDEDVRHSADFDSGNSKASITFEKNKVNIVGFNINRSHNDTIHLNNEVTWNMDIDTGAADGDIDLSGVRLDNLSMDVGAANMKLKLGSSNSRLVLKAGVSNIKIEIPQDTGIRVNLDGGLNNTNFDEAGWVKKGGSYYSPDYDSKAFKMDADVEMGLGKLSIE